MATRFYLTSAAPDYTPATVRGTWADTSLAATNAFKLGTTKEGTNSLVTFTETIDTNNTKVLLSRHISGPLAGGSITGGSGSFQHVQARQEAAANNNLTLQIHVYATVGDTDVVRDTYLNSFTGATEFATSMTILSYTSAIPTAITIDPGDRLVIEIGYNAANTTIDAVGSNRIGGTAADLATSGTTGVTTDSPWFEFLGTGSDAAVAPYVPPGGRNAAPDFMPFFF